MPERLRVTGACTGRVAESDFPTVLEEALLKALDREPNAPFPKERWVELSRSLVSRAGLLMVQEGRVRFVCALEEAYLAAQCTTSVLGPETENSNAAFSALLDSVRGGALRNGNFVADLTSMALVAISAHNDEAHYNQLLGALLERASASRITSEEAVRVLFALEVASDETALGPSLTYPTEYFDETGELRSTTEDVDDAKVSICPAEHHRLSRFSTGSIANRHRPRHGSAPRPAPAQEL